MLQVEASLPVNMKFCVFIKSADNATLLEDLNKHKYKVVSQQFVTKIC